MSIDTPDDRRIANAFRLMKSFYDAAEHRLTFDRAIRAAAAAGYTPEALAQLTALHDAVLKEDENGYVLTPRGVQWYEDCLALLMARTE